MKVIGPDVGYSVGNPIKITVNFNAEVPKAPEDYPVLKGTMTVLLETTLRRRQRESVKRRASEKVTPREIRHDSAAMKAHAALGSAWDGRS